MCPLQIKWEARIYSPNTPPLQKDGFELKAIQKPMQETLSFSLPKIREHIYRQKQSTSTLSTKVNKRSPQNTLDT